MKGVDVREQDGFVIVAVQVRPKSRPGIEITDAGLVIRVKSLPEKGRATEEASLALARVLEVPPSAVSLRSGRTSRRKSFAVEGTNATDVRTKLLAAAQHQSDPRPGA